MPFEPATSLQTENDHALAYLIGMSGDGAAGED